MKKIVKIALALIALIMLLGITSKAAAPALPALPALPYVPPSKVQIFDLINNILGLTKLGVTDDQKRAQAYEEMMLRYMTQADIDEIVQRARERRKIEIKAGVRDGLQQYALYQVQTGYNEVITPTVVGAQETYNKLMEWTRINQTMLPYAKWQDFANSANTKFGVNGWTVYGVWASYRGGWQIVVGAVGKDTKMTYYANSGVNPNNGNGYYPNGTSATANYTSVVMSTPISQTSTNIQLNWAIQSNTKIATNNYYYGLGMSYDSKVMTGTSANRKAQVQSSAITTALQNSQDIPITANTELVNGAVSTTQTISVDIPNVMPTPAETVSQLQDVQQQLGVVPLPITQDVTATIAQLQELQDTRYGDTEQYELSLTSFFPFCIPYDLYWILTAFDQPAEAPNFDIAISNPFHGENEEAYFTYHVDLSMFDGVASLFRKLELIIFVVGLCLISRNLILRG